MAEVEGANWKAPYELKYRYPKASILGNQQVIFDICGNKYRLWTQISYKNGIVLIKNIGTHKEYENWKLG
ncbi:MAG: type II toxin-antitoxin system HigB family toxin [Dehalococcoidales bacterium]|nr:type II toxin-antitoxin system HigB family toxin [Dehalococcoidales bacterium]